MSDVVFKAVTTTREDIIAIAQVMARAIQPEVFFDRDRPLVISVNGSLRCGKALIKDTLLDTLFDENSVHAREMRPGYDEYHTGTIGGRKVDLHYIDAAYSEGFFHDALNLLPFGMLEDTFLEYSARGGIAVIQNHSTLGAGDISVWMEGQSSRTENMRILGGYDRKSERPENKDLAEQFKRAHDRIKAADGTSWTRYVEVSLHDERLRANTTLVQNLRTLFARINGATTAANDSEHRARKDALQFAEHLKRKGLG